MFSGFAWIRRHTAEAEPTEKQNCGGDSPRLFRNIKRLARPIHPLLACFRIGKKNATRGSRFSLLDEPCARQRLLTVVFLLSGRRRDGYDDALLLRRCGKLGETHQSHGRGRG